MRCGAHSDTGALTLLWSDAAGLELQPSKSGKKGDPNAPWVAVDPSAFGEVSSAADTGGDSAAQRTMVVNIGDLLEHISKGKWRSTPHRVLAPALDSAENRDRLVLVNFITLAVDFPFEMAAEDGAG
eukprot:gene67-32_t